MEGEVGREASRARKVRNRPLLRLWEDLVQGQVDLARVTCAASCGRCVDQSPRLQDRKMSLIPPVLFSLLPRHSPEGRGETKGSGAPR